VDEYASLLDLKDDYNVEKHETWLDAYQSEFLKQLRFQLHETQDKPLICMFQNSNFVSILPMYQSINSKCCLKFF
jgi:hypothetical protein